MNKKSFFTAAFFSVLFLIMGNSILAQVKKKPIAKPSIKKTVSIKSTPQKSNIKKPEVIAGTRVKLTTDSGVMIIRLYDKTPKHRDNFIKLANEHFYDSLLFHRVIAGFMIQGGDPQSKTAPAGAMLGSGDIGYTIPAEFDTSLYHKKGALCAARTNNPEKASSSCQFYIVQGKKFTDAELDGMEMQAGTKFSAAKRLMYKTKGGTPFLDNNYTVFGEVEKGLEVIDKIASVPKDGTDRPLGNVRMKIEVIK